MNLNRNIVIEASAGTGKTYTLVQTILQALFQKNLPMDALVALTFTKKAAGEMKERIALELQKVERAEKIAEAWRAWGQPLDVLKARAREALETIDRAAIGTIHSYAYSLLMRFPIAAGISPAAEVDDKEIRTDDLFEEEWPKWLRKQLSVGEGERGSGRAEDWLEVLGHVSLKDVRALARRLCDFDIPLEALPLSDTNLKTGLTSVQADIRKLIIGKPEDVKSTRIAKACEEVIGAFCHPRAGGDPSLDSRFRGNDSELAEKPTPTKDWPAEDIKKLKIIRAIALNLLERGDRTLTLLTELLKPFIKQFRSRLLAEGYLSNNALLILARDLVAKNFQVRETLKEKVRLIFIDEFQDTDPLQGELLLFLAETTSGRAKSWEDVRLEPGKLFIVGDPKQSIYLFRGADISAYSRITDMVIKQGGERKILEDSYRSHEKITHAVNAAFGSLIQEKAPISPAYRPLNAKRKSEDSDRHLIELRLAHSKEPRKSEESLNQEAEDAATWIAQAHASKRWSYEDIALVFRSGPAMAPFIDKLRQYNIPFVVESERYFYRTPEVTDVLNLLRVLDDSSNRIALAGFLRSPLGGFNDPELALLQSKNGLRLEKPLPKELSEPAHEGAWDLLRSLSKRAGREPLKSILKHVYDDTYLLELAARSYHRDQTIANLLKLKRVMESFAEEGETTLGGLLTKIDRFMKDDRLEGESPLADATSKAVRLMTIHKAKGLEFPVVWLPGLHRSSGDNPDAGKITARYDWATGRLGISLGNRIRNMEDFILDREFTEREEAEEARVLYVAMTRAKDHLILSGGVCKGGQRIPRQPAIGSFLEMLAGAWQMDLESIPEGELALGQGVITVRKSPPLAAPSAEPGKAEGGWLESFDLAKIAATWKERAQQYEIARSTPLITTPTSAIRYELSAIRYDKPLTDIADSRYRIADSSARLLGTLLHLFLEHWDFIGCAKCEMPAKLRVIANSYFASEGLLKEPFPDPKDGEKANNPPELVEIVEEAQRMLADFIGSEAWEEIKNSEILGREVPFFYAKREALNVNREGIPDASRDTIHEVQPLMRGTMDILYRTKDGQLVIGDYKSGSTTQDYLAQGAAYQEAVRRALGEEAIFKIISLREEDAVPS